MECGGGVAPMTPRVDHCVTLPLPVAIASGLRLTMEGAAHAHKQPEGAVELLEPTRLGEREEVVQLVPERVARRHTVVHADGVVVGTDNDHIGVVGIVAAAVGASGPVEV